MSELWEILVPVSNNKGTKFKVSFHRKWDEKIRAMCGGLSIMPVTKGQWVNPQNVLFAEKMIPVRVSCTEEQIEEIIDMTIDYYNQEAVMAYRISTRCIIRRK